MKPVYFPVHPALQAFVSHIMVVDVRLDGPAYSRLAPFPPTPQNCLNFYPGDVTRSRQGQHAFHDLPACTIVGPQTTKVDLAMGPRHRFVSVAFQPGGLFRLLRLPLHELRDAPLNGADLLGPELREVSEKLQAATQPQALKNIVEAYLLRKMSPAATSPFERAIKLLLSGNPAYAIDDIAALACLSNRQFERKSHDVLGYSPKFFARLVRFSKAYRLKVNQPQASWTTISHRSGYYDQMHLIRDFKAFTATTPKLLALEMLNSPLKIQAGPRL
ncbi:helix-turn-helix domain-containing protein [Hymenobacter sp. M29]|uniref:Helix-turn-helix domain-containing protein n=1 Tax=Hymenobacter mellowenesis TaxID=3063995 RepID=A0ABT9AH13_9BACT|nr:helix-turn-helix domain-containing protein [Hymenobacter sp. M29]MDO7849164.1 helix-turn-helix domain-containing protein [Hymenobacter sp. M29]